MKRSGFIRRKQTPEAKAKRDARRELDFGPLAKYVRTLPCCVCGRGSDYTQACHVKSRGAGGRAYLDNGDGNLLNMCGTCHQLQHLKGWSVHFSGGQAEAALLAKELAGGMPDYYVKRS